MTDRLLDSDGKVLDYASPMLQLLPLDQIWSTLPVLILWGLDTLFVNGGADDEGVYYGSAAFFYSHILVVNCVIGIVTEAEKHRLEKPLACSRRLFHFAVHYLAVLSIYLCVRSNSLRLAAWLFSAARLLITMKMYPCRRQPDDTSDGSGKSEDIKSCSSPAGAHCSTSRKLLRPSSGWTKFSDGINDSVSSIDVGLLPPQTSLGSEELKLHFSSGRTADPAAPSEPDSAGFRSPRSPDTRLGKLRSRRRVQFHPTSESKEQRTTRPRSNSDRTSLRNLQPSMSVKTSFAIQGKKAVEHRAAAAMSKSKLVCNDSKSTLLKNTIQRVLLPRHNSAAQTIFHKLCRSSNCKDRLECTKKLELMCVEDDKVQQAVTAKLVKKHGFRVTAFDSGERALECLAKRYAEDGGHDNFPDIVLMDIMLPGMSGYEATEAIRSLYPTAPLPVIMVTGCEDEDTLLTSISCGASDMVEKSRLATSLMARISAQLVVLHFWRSKLQAKKHQSLLQEILPRSVIERIGPLESRRLIYDEHEEVSIVFTDIVGFTDLSSSADTRSVIELLDSLFNAFDSLTKKHGVYKVETIGDAYMLVAGHEEDSQSDHALRAVRIAADMLEVARSFTMPNGEPLRIRAGIHSGPAFSGVVGHLRPRYCLFGDTVNVASRMESTSFPDCIQLSSSTVHCYNRQRVSLQQSDVSCTVSTVRKSVASPQDEIVSLGLREIKGKGKMNTSLVKAGDWQEAWQQYHDMKESDCLPIK